MFHQQYLRHRSIISRFYLLIPAMQLISLDTLIKCRMKRAGVMTLISAISDDSRA